MGTHTAIRFHKPKTLAKARKSKFTAVPKSTVRSDKFSLIRYPLSTEKAMKKMEDENTMVFIVDSRTNKKQIKPHSKIYITLKLKVSTHLIDQTTRKRLILDYPLKAILLHWQTKSESYDQICIML